MSSTTPTSPLQRADDVAAYVAAVRFRLNDLAPEEVEELTGGLEADVAEALSGVEETPAERFGDPVAYADELRAAADLPPRREPAPAGITGTLTDLRRDINAAVDTQLDAMRGLPWFEPVRDFLVGLRPAWWVLRAWIAVALLRLWLNASETGIIGSLPSFVLLVLAIVGSVTLGRRSPLANDAGRVGVMLGNVLAVLLFFPVIGQFAEPPHDDVSYTDPNSPPHGLWMNGVEISNVVPYDVQGRPLHGVALYDEYGQPLTLSSDCYGDQNGLGTPIPSNVFPKACSDGTVEPPADDGTVTDPGATPTEDAETPAPETPVPTTPSAAATPAATTPATPPATTPVVTPTR